MLQDKIKVMNQKIEQKVNKKSRKLWKTLEIWRLELLYASGKYFRDNKQKKWKWDNSQKNELRLFHST